MLKKLPFFGLIVTVILCSFVCSVLVTDDDDPVKDPLCSYLSIAPYNAFFQKNLACANMLYGFPKNIRSVNFIISYLARYEKSPPHLS